MPQTIEAYNHAKAAGVEIIVAVNKCDVPGVSPDRIRQELMQYELVPEEYGGDTMFVNISALKGDGIDELLDSLLLVAEVGEYTAVHDRHAEGNVLEARVARGRGTVATLLVKEGTLERGNILVLGTTWGRIRNMTDHKGDPLKVAGPATPVEVTGLQTVPQSGDDFVVVKSEKDAKALVKNREDLARAKAISGHQRVTLEDLMALGQEQEKVQLNLIVKTDVGGTLEAIKGAFDKVEVEGTSIKILHASVGGITESDVTLAHTYGAIIIGFNVRPDANARKASDAYNVEIRTYQVIYEAIEEIEQALKGLLGPTIKEKIHGLAEIRQTFKVPKVGTIAGCMVLEGKISRSYQVRLLRDSIMIWEGQLGSLRRFKDDVKEVEKGYECGMNLAGFNDIKVGDHLEVFAMEAIEA